jgi:FRG domain
LSEDLTKKEPNSKDVLEIEARTLSDFCRVVDNITDSWRSEVTRRQEANPREVDFFPGELSPWFRGITDEGYDLEPTLLRDSNRSYLLPHLSDNERERILKIEKYLLQRFKTFSTPLLTRVPELEIQWFFLMQHHNLYTRLLDWSKSSSISLFFAIRKYEEKQKEAKLKCRSSPSAAVWILEPRRLSEFSPHGTRSIYGANNEKHIPLINKYLGLDESINEKKLDFPLPLIPDLVSPRITSQLGRFTLHTDKKDSLINFAKKLYKDEGRWYLIKIIIPHENHKSILRSLRTSGISFIDIAQDLDGISEELKWRMRLGASDSIPTQSEIEIESVEK